MTNSAQRLRIRPARLFTFAAFGLAGLIFWTSFNTAQGTNLRTDDSMLRLTDLIYERDRANQRLDGDNASLRDDVDSLAERDHGAGTAPGKELREAERAAGATEVDGAGLTVTLTDAPPDATALIPGVPDPTPDTLVVHQQDLQAVVNALWTGGAEGIRVMDQRLISTSAVRCVGNTLILQGRVYSPPYKITAVGDPRDLQAALDAEPAVQNYLRYVEAYGLGYEVDPHDSVTLPGYSGPVDLHHARPVE
ncbi:DUF881 domain-containing protein [Streptomyces sp. MAR4 CNY-716]